VCAFFFAATYGAGFLMTKFFHALQSVSAAVRCNSSTHYRNPGAAADWLAKTFGFTVRLRIANHRIRMRAGKGCFTIAEGKAGPNSQHVQVRIEDVRRHCERARQSGAEILTEPQDHPYGERQYNAQDFYGHRWDFTETIADIAPEEWSSGKFHLE
jgi:uncharacterized glyoxalase superfamily protein PhnB